MSRVSWSPMVGNDMVVTMDERDVVPRPTVSRHKFVFPQAPKDDTLNDLSTFTFNEPELEQVPLILPSSPATHHKARFFNKAKIIPFVGAVVFLALITGIVANRQQVMALTRRVGSFSSQLIQDITKGKAATPGVNPRQLIIHSSDYDSAMTALLTQQVTLNFGDSSQTVNGSNIANWLSIKNQGPLTVIAVDSQQLSNYLNQSLKTSGIANNSAVYSKVFNQIADNLLKAKGVTVSVPSAS